MKVKIPSMFLDKTDLVPSNEVTFIDAGKEVTNAFGKKVFQFKVKTSLGEDKLATLNKTSLRWMIDTYTDETDTWIGKVVKVHPIQQMVSNKMKTVLYFGEVPTDDDESAAAATEEPTIDDLFPVKE